MDAPCVDYVEKNKRFVLPVNHSAACSTFTCNRPDQ